MEEKPIFIIVGTLTVLIGLVPLLGVMDNMGEATSRNHDAQQLEKLMTGINEQCNGRSNFIQLDLQSGQIGLIDSGNTLKLEVADQEVQKPLDCEAIFSDEIEGDKIGPGKMRVTFNQENDDNSEPVEVNTH